jgi:hypothetical protein
MTPRDLCAAPCAALLLCALACAHPYRAPEGPVEQTALVRLETRATALMRWEISSTFYVDARDYGEDGCPGRWTDGGKYLGRVELEREGGRAEIRVPTGTRVFFSASYFSQTFGASARCDLTYGFVPEAGHTYRVEHAGNRRSCEVRVTDESSPEPIALMGRDRCPEDV